MTSKSSFASLMSAIFIILSSSVGYPRILMLPYQIVDLSMTHEHNDNPGTILMNHPWLFKKSVCPFGADVIIATSIPLA